MSQRVVRPDAPDRPSRVPAAVPVLVLLLTVGQLAVAQWVPGIDRFADKAFGARLVAYPVLMLLAPALWWLLARRGARGRTPPPYGAFTLVMLGFLVDVTGNSLDLYDQVSWWDDANHLGNWFLLTAGLGLLVAGPVRPRWARVLLVAGLGALLAIGWELGEWWTFIRHGTEIDTAYADTLGDEALGSLGALVAGIVVAVTGRRDDPAPTAAPTTGQRPTGVRRARLLLPALVWAGTVALLLVATLTPGHLGDPAAPYRLVAYPLLGLVLPAVWLLARVDAPVPATATTLVLLPFAVDSVGNVLDLYRRVSWWDDANHVANWLLLSAGIGLALVGRVRPTPALVTVVVGLGALLAVVWELGERAFFYSPPYGRRLYEDTLADQVLGTGGAALAGLLVGVVALSATRRGAASGAGRAGPRSGRGGRPGSG